MWTLPELVAEAAAKLAAMPAPKNGQVRAVPDERTVRYYAALGLLDKPAAMRGRTALYTGRHLAQVIAIKRLQGAGRSLADIQALWPQLDDASLARMSGVEVPRSTSREFWKSAPPPPTEPNELRLELAPGATLILTLPAQGVSITDADLRAIRAAAQPLVNELANRRTK